MPFYKKRYFNKRNARQSVRSFDRKKYKTMPWYSRKYSAADIAKTALWGVNKLRGLVNSELYKWDVVETGAIITSSQSSYSARLAAIAQGDGDNARTGNSIFARSLNIRGQVIYNSAGTSPEFLRVMVILDTQQVGDQTPNIMDVLENNGYNSHLLKSTVGRFKVLFSSIYEVDSVNNLSRSFNINLPMRHHIRYNGTAGTDMQKGGLYIMAISSEATNGPTFRFDSRLSYHDN